MNDIVESLGPEILLGRAIRARRTAKHMTLEDLAEITDLSASFLSRVENAKASPSVQALRQIARAMETTAADLLRLPDDEAESRLTIVRSHERTVIARGRSDLGYTYETVAGIGRSDVVELFIVRFPPGRAASRLFEHEGREFQLVLDGRINFTYGDKVYDLGRGDSMYFDSSVSHGSVATGPNEAVVLAVLIDSDG
jgi:transcriptional regulator with XRE-family HTH domain